MLSCPDLIFSGINERSEQYHLTGDSEKNFCLRVCVFENFHEVHTKVHGRKILVGFVNGQNSLNRGQMVAIFNIRLTGGFIFSKQSHQIKAGKHGTILVF